MKQTFAISDLHLNHANIIKYCHRPFSSVQEMNRVLLENWNKVIGKDDDVYFVGDLSRFGSDKFLESMNGNILFIEGNHDIEGSHTKYRSLVAEFSGVVLLFCHDTREVPSDYSGWVVHGHNHNNDVINFPFFNPVLRHVNVSVEIINYRPVNLDYIINLIKTQKTALTYIPEKYNQTPQGVPA